MGVAGGVTVIKAMNSKPKRGLEDMEERDIEELDERLRRNRKREIELCIRWIAISSILHPKMSVLA
ncbi:unnamed protein product, partial [Clonostachys chloroleuca]